MNNINHSEKNEDFLSQQDFFANLENIPFDEYIFAEEEKKGETESNQKQQPKR